jgi:hypothetical protein
VSEEQQENPDPAEAAEPDEDLAEFDYMDPLKRDAEDDLPGLDPIIPPVPPEE